MAPALSSLVPDADDLLSLEVEELAGVLLAHLNGFETRFPHLPGCISHSHFFEELRTHGPFGQPEYGERQPEVNQALKEAWAWLEREAFLVRDPVHPLEQYFVSRRGQRLKSRNDFDAYRRANLLPKGQLHPLIASQVYPAFLRGDYPTAIFQAFKEIEVAVRTAGGFEAEDLGMPLMRMAFRPGEKGSPVPAGPLADGQLPVGEQEAMAHLFAGAIGVYKNPQSHRHVPTRPEDAAEVIVFASQLLRIVDRLKPSCGKAVRRIKNSGKRRENL